MKKIFILLFPQIEYLDNQNNDANSFNECIKERYIKKGYEFVVVKYKYSNLGFINLIPNRCIDADVTFEESNPYTSANFRYANFNLIANKLNLKDAKHIVVGGFHCYDCVEKFSKEIYKLNNNVLIDSDLTEQFWKTKKYQQNWNIRNFKPEQKLEIILSLDCNSSHLLLQKIKKRYSHPIWGITDEMLKSLENKINPTTTYLK